MVEGIKKLALGKVKDIDELIVEHLKYGLECLSDHIKDPFYQNGPASFLKNG